MWLATLAVCAAAAAPGKLALVKRDASGTTQLAQLDGLADAARDLSADEAHDNEALASVTAEIGKLAAKKSELLGDSAKKRKEIVLLRTEVSSLSSGLSKADMDEVLSREGAAATLSAEAESAAAAEATAKATAAAKAQAEAEAEAQAEAQAQAEAAAKAQAEAAEKAAAEARVQAEAAEARRAAAAASAKEAAAEAEAQRAKAESASAKAKAAQYTARAAATSQQSTASQSRTVTASRKTNTAADLDDDGLSSYLKDEDGEDEQDDVDYNDSANALASAIGWNRNEVETKANNAVKALTDAIGGKKVVQQVQGMMAGMSAIGR